MVIIFFLSAKCMCYQQPSQEEPNVIAHCSWAASSRARLREVARVS